MKLFSVKVDCQWKTNGCLAGEWKLSQILLQPLLVLIYTELCPDCIRVNTPRKHTHPGMEEGEEWNCVFQIKNKKLKKYLRQTRQDNQSLRAVENAHASTHAHTHTHTHTHICTCTYTHLYRPTIACISTHTATHAQGMKIVADRRVQITTAS